MVNNRQYQKDMAFVGKALEYLDQCDFRGTGMLTPYRQLSKAHYQWLMTRKEARKHNGSEVYKLYNSRKYSPEEIADKMGMNGEDVAYLIVHHALFTNPRHD